MPDKVVVRSMNMDEFKSLQRGGGGAKSPQREAMEALQAGTVIVIHHTAAGCGRKLHGTSGYCTINSMIGFINRGKSESHLWSRHLEDGNVAVACIAKPE